MLSKYWLSRLAIATPLALLAVGPAAASMEAGFSAFQEGNYQAALDAWLAEAEKGNPTAQFNVGQLYRLGKGVTRDDQLAAQWYRRAAAQGYGPAERNLQLMAAEGRLTTVEDQSPAQPVGAGIPGAGGGTLDMPAARSREELGLTAFQNGDFQQAMDAWLPLAAQGDATAQFNLGQLYRLGKGVQQSDREAIRWYRRAALQGHTMAVHNLRLMYQDDRVPMEEQGAVKTILAGLENGDSEAPSLAASALVERIPTVSTEQPSLSTVAEPALPMATPPKVNGSGMHGVQMLSRPMIGDNAAPPTSTVPTVPATPKTPTAPVLSRRDVQAPPVPRPRPAVTRQDASTIIAASVTPMPTPPVTVPGPKVPESVTIPEPPADVRVPIANGESRVARATALQSKAKPVKAPAVGPQVAKATPSDANANTTKSPRRSSQRSVDSLVTVAEVLDMNSLVVEVEPVPVAPVSAVLVGNDATDSSSGSIGEPIDVATVDTTTVALQSRTEPPIADTGPVTVATTSETEPPTGIVQGKDWLEAQNPESYVIQIMASNRQTHLEAFLDTLPTLDQPVSLVATARRNRPWYVLLLGPYPGFSNASAVLDELADSVKVNGPWIRPVSKIQSVMR